MRTFLKDYWINLFWCLRLFLGTYVLIGLMDFITVYNAARQLAPFKEIVREGFIPLLFGSVIVVLISLPMATVIHRSEWLKRILELISCLCILLFFIFCIRFFNPNLPISLYRYGFILLLLLFILFGPAFHYYAENLIEIGWYLAILIHISLAVLTPASFLAVTYGLYDSLLIKGIRPVNPPKEDPPPNIIVITFDSLNAKNMSLYGYSRKTTPFFEELAKTSYVFQRAIACFPETESSTVSLFTSKYPWNHGVSSFPVPQKVQKESILSVLQQKGYQTIWVSDCRTGHANPLYNGLWPGVDCYAVDRLPHFAGTIYHNLLSRKQSVPYNLLVSSCYLPVIHLWRVLTAKKSSQEPVFQEASKILRKNARLPFFLYVRAVAPEGYDGCEWRDFRGTFSKKDEHIYISRLSKYVAVRGAMQHLGHHIDVLRDYYDDDILFADSNLRSFINELKNEGLYDNSIIIVSSDHGESIEKELWGHDSLHNVPLLIHLPGQLEGHRVETPVSHIDIAPTILNLLGLPVPPFMEGESLMLVMSCKVAEYKPKFTLNPVGQELIFAVWHKDYKLIYHVENSQKELYNLKEDPNEEINLADKDTEACNLLTNFVLQGLFYDKPNWTPLGHSVKWATASQESASQGPYKKVDVSPERLKVNTEKPGLEKKFLTDGKEDTFWHVSYPHSEPFPKTEIQIDLESPTQVNILRIKPREGESQMWHGNYALFVGSSDGKAWIPLVGLSLPRRAGDDWLTFELPNSTSYKYYKLSIMGTEFLSMAELELGHEHK